MALIIQTTLLKTFPTWGIRCDIIWLLVLFIGFYHELWEGLPSLLFLGYLMDCFASPFLGLFTASYLIIFFVLRLLTIHIYIEALTSKMFWVFVMTLIGKYVGYLLLLWLDVSIQVQFSMLWNTFIQGLWNGILAIILFPILKYLMSWIYQRDYAYSVSSR